MADKINILYMIDHFHMAGGTETHLTHLVRNLNKERFNASVVVFDFADNPLAKKIYESGIPIIHMQVLRYYTYNAFKKAISLSKFIKNKNIDIVQTFHFKSDFYGAIVAKLSGVKHIISSKRDTGDLKSKWHFFLNRRVKKIFQGVIAVANAVGEEVALMEHIPHNKITTIYNGVNLDRFSVPDEYDKNKTRKSLGLNKNDFIVGTVAWFRPEKNYNVFFKAIEKVCKSINELRVIAVGGGQQLEYFKNYISNIGLADRIVFTGPTDDVTRYLKVLDVACLVPGRNEGFSNSVLEKMSMGLPIIVTDVGGNAEAVIDGFNGLVIPPDDSEALSEAIIGLYQYPEKRKKMGLRSRQRVEEYFTIQKMVQRHEEYYEYIMNAS